VRTRFITLPIIACAASLISSPANAAAHCALTNFEVSTYAHSGAYLGGVLEGQYRSFLIICGVTVSGSDCSVPATDRNLSVALTARALGRPLSLYFDTVGSCAAVTNYTQVAAVTLAP